MNEPNAESTVSRAAVYVQSCGGMLSVVAVLSVATQLISARSRCSSMREIGYTTMRCRLDPVGLTAGEHFGTKEKIYTKLKNTRPNVMVRDAKGELAEQSLPAISDDGLTIRAKMLETEFVKTPERLVQNTTDYLADLQLIVNGKPAKWNLSGEHPGPDDVHIYWDWAE